MFRSNDSPKGIFIRAWKTLHYANLPKSKLPIGLNVSRRMFLAGIIPKMKNLLWGFILTPVITTWIPYFEYIPFYENSFYYIMQTLGFHFVKIKCKTMLAFWFHFVKIKLKKQVTTCFYIMLSSEQIKLILTKRKFQWIDQTRIPIQIMLCWSWIQRGHF